MACSRCVTTSRTRRVSARPNAGSTSHSSCTAFASNSRARTRLYLSPQSPGIRGDQPGPAEQIAVAQRLHRGGAASVCLEVERAGAGADDPEPVGGVALVEDPCPCGERDLVRASHHGPGPPPAVRGERCCSSVSSQVPAAAVAPHGADRVHTPRLRQRQVAHLGRKVPLVCPLRPCSVARVGHGPGTSAEEAPHPDRPYPAPVRLQGPKPRA